jgi:hypothetical protein
MKDNALLYTPKTKPYKKFLEPLKILRNCTEFCKLISSMVLLCFISFHSRFALFCTPFCDKQPIQNPAQTCHSLRPIRLSTLRRRWLHVMYKRRSRHTRINKVYMHQTVARQWISTASYIQFRFAEPRILLSHSRRAKKAFGV